MGNRGCILVSTILLLVALVPVIRAAHLSTPHVDDHAPHVLEKNKFFRQSLPPSDSFPLAEDLDRKLFSEEGEVDHSCPQPSLQMSWVKEMESSIYSTPVIADLHFHREREIIASTLVKYLEVMHGGDGSELDGWPFVFRESRFYSSPLLYDVDRDGRREIIVSTLNGEIAVFRADGRPIPEGTLRLHKLRVRRDWYKTAREKLTQNLDQGKQMDEDTKPNLEPSVSRTTEDTQQAQQVSKDTLPSSHDKSTPEPTMTESKPSRRKSGTVPKKRRNRRRPSPDSLDIEPSVSEDLFGFEDEDEDIPQIDQEPDGKDTEVNENWWEDPELFPGYPERSAQSKDLDAKRKRMFDSAPKGKAYEKPSYRRTPRRVGGRRLLAVDTNVDSAANPASDTFSTMFDGLTDEAVDSMKEFVFRRDDKSEKSQRTEKESVDVASDADHDLREFRTPTDPMTSASNVEADDDDNVEEPVDSVADDEFVWLDPHILATPSITDLDGDGSPDLIIPVSYYLDKSDYQYSKASRIPPDLDISKYVSGGLVVVDLSTKKVKWKIHLDLSTDDTKLRAYIYSSPTVIDLDGEGKPSVVVATSMGFIYAFDAQGRLRENFPVWMAEIQGQVAAEDIDHDGKIELCVCDGNNNLACWRSDGTELWDRRIFGFAASNIVFGDVNGDGRLDLVFGTTTGHIYAIDAATGDILPHFPLRTGGRIIAPVLLTKLVRRTLPRIEKAQEVVSQDSNDDSQNTQERDKSSPTIDSSAVPPSWAYADSPLHTLHRPGLDLVVPSFDGYLYFVDGSSGCVNRFDIGENSYSMVLADDLNGNGLMNILVTTMNGNLMNFETDTPFHPLRTWTSQTQGLNGFSFRENTTGIFFTESSRQFRDIRSQSFEVQFTIVDSKFSETCISRHADGSISGPYVVKILTGDGDILLQKAFERPGTYVESILTPKERELATLRIILVNQHYQHFFDEFPVSFNYYFYRSVKWVIFTPFALVIVGIFLSPPSTASVSSTSSRSDSPKQSSDETELEPMSSVQGNSSSFVPSPVDSSFTTLSPQSHTDPTSVRVRSSVH